MAEFKKDKAENVDTVNEVSAPVTVILEDVHEDAGVVYKAGDKLELDPIAARFLVSQKKGRLA